jgi:hypothetical protein
MAATTSVGDVQSARSHGRKAQLLREPLRYTARKETPRLADDDFAKLHVFARREDFLENVPLDVNRFAGDKKKD